MLKPAIKGWLIGRRYKRPTTTSSGLALPDFYLTGQDSGDSSYRLVEVLGVPSDLEGIVEVGDLVLVHEIEICPIPLSGTEYELQSVPWELVKGHGKTVEDLKPLRDVVFIEQQQVRQEKTFSGLLFLPDSNAEAGIDRYGEVFKKGPKVTSLEVGDKILHLKGFELSLKYGNIEFVAISEKDVVGVVGEH